ncbi:hypothetical protein BG015_001092, partial [Linnemannia schmuckeri]
KKVTILQNHGNLIRHLHCHRVDKRLLQVIARHSPSLETIHLTFDKHSLWATPDHLGEVFLRLQDRLVTVSLMFDFFEVDLEWLDRLKVLKCVTKLVLTVSKYADNLIYVCAKVMDCCPKLEEFELICEGVPVDLEADMGEGGGTLNRLWAGVQKGMVSAINKLPTAVREPIGRQQPTAITPSPRLSLGSSSHESSLTTSTTTSPTASVHPITSTNPWEERHALYTSCDMYLHKNLRRFKVIDGYSYRLTFPGFAQYCPNLEEIDVHAKAAWFEADEWNRLAKACPQLRSLRVHSSSAKYDLSSHKHVFTLFPRLELLSASTSNLMHWSDWKAATLDDCLAHHSQHRPDGAATPLPLKALHLYGYFGYLENLLEVLSINSPLLALETLIVGFFKQFREYSEWATYPGEMESHIKRKFGLMYYHLHMMDLPWNRVMVESLTRLDISMAILVDRNVVGIMFKRFQELRNLRALSVSAIHLRKWIPDTFSFTLPTFHDFTSFPINNIDSSSTTTPINNNSSITSTYYHDLLDLPKVEYHFPSLEDLIVEPIIFHKAAIRKYMTVDEAVYALASMPGLEYFYLRRREECMEDETYRALRRVFPRQFTAIPEERLDWLVRNAPLRPI